MICGIEFRVTWRNEDHANRLKRLCRDLFVLWRSKPDGADNDGGSIEVIELTPAGRLAHTTGTSPEHVEGVSKQPLTVWHRPDGYKLASPGAVFENRGRRASLAFSEAFWRRPVLEQREFLQNSMLMMLQSLGMHGLHASGVAKGRTGVLFAADSGGGKTTSALSLMSVGWRYVGDDAVVLGQRDGVVVAHALRTGYSWTAKTRTSFPALHPADGQWRPLGEGKWLAVPGGMAQGRRVRACTPRLLLFPEVARSATTRLEPVGPSEALVRLIEQSSGILAARESSKAQLEMLSTLVRQSRSYRFIAGRDVLRDPESISNLLLRTAASHG